MTVLKFNKESFKIISDRITYPIKNSIVFMKLLGVNIDRDTKLLFKNEGALQPYGIGKWTPFAKSTMEKLKCGLGKIRYGTDLKGRPKGTYKPNEVRSNMRRYNTSSKLLQASGGFKKTWGKPFGVFQISATRLKYGTNIKIAEKIMSVKNRQVLKFNERRYQAISNLFYSYIDKGIKL